MKKKTPSTTKKTSKKASETPIVRRSIRFAPDEGDFAWVINSESEKIPALIVNESLNGVCLIAQCKKRIKKDDTYLFMLGNLSPMPGRVMWTEELDGNTLKFGFKYNK